MRARASPLLSFFSNDTATTAIYTLSLHDALPILRRPGVARRLRARAAGARARRGERPAGAARGARRVRHQRDRKSTRLNSSHVEISYAVFCLKKKNKNRHLKHHRHPTPHIPCTPV